MPGLPSARSHGVELRLAGLVFGLDVMRPALKLPGFGRIGMDRETGPVS
jgi:hypothetical protein